MSSRRFDPPVWVQLVWRDLYVHHKQPTTQIAEKCGALVSAVRRALLRLNVTLRPPGGGSRRHTH